MNIPVYLINLPQDQQRLAWMKEQCAGLGIDVLVIPAVLGRALPQTEIDQLYDVSSNRFRYHRSLTLGEIGCYASHRLVWQRMITENHAYALILEDDVILDAQLIQVLEWYVSASCSADMLKLIGRTSEKVASSIAVTDQFSLIQYQRIPSSAAAYILTFSGAQKLLSRKRFFRPVDVDFRYWWETDLRVKGIVPYPVSFAELNNISSIGSKPAQTAWSRILKLIFKLEYWIKNIIREQS